MVNSISGINDGPQPQKYYCTEDLFRAYVQPFLRKRILGGLKGFDFPIFETGDWIVQTRYLLSEIKDEHIAALFEIGEAGKDYFFYCTASWIAALLKKEEHLDQIGKYAMQGGNQFWSATFYASLLLFDNKNVHEYFLEYLKNDPDKKSSSYHNSKPLVVFALRLYDKKNNTAHALPWSQIGVGRREENLILTILKFSEILRGGIQFNHSSELQRELKVLLNQTVSPLQYVNGLLYQHPVREIPTADFVEKERTSHAKKFLAAYVINRKFEVNYSLPERPFAKINRIAGDFELTRFTSVFLADSANPEMTGKLKDLALKTQNAADILASLESDLFYKLPGSIITIYFKKLFVLINPSYQLFELYATHLLLRGTEKDSKARALHKHAQKIKENIIWIEENNYKYAMKK